jgi:predicted dehydrogenase
LSAKEHVAGALVGARATDRHAALERRSTVQALTGQGGELELPTFNVRTLRGGRSWQWAVLAPGEIAADFTRTLHENSSHRVVAVGSRSPDRARAFASKFGVDRSYGSYDAAVADSAVDAVYVAAPNRFHAEVALLAIDAGKPVLVEKPFGVDAAETARVAHAGEQAGVFVMEAMWTRYLPQFRVLSEILEHHELGDVHLATANVGWKVPQDDTENKIFSPELAGGVGLDMSVYGLWFTRFVFGQPTAVQATGSLTPRGVDDQFVAALAFGQRQHATVSASMLVTNSGYASVHGTQGSVEFIDYFVFPSRMRLTVNGKTSEWDDGTGLKGRDGLVWQAVAMAEYLEEGRLQSPVWPMSESIALARTLDDVETQLRAVSGLR